MGQRSFFDVEDRLQSVGKMGDPLEILAEAIAWEEFRPLLAKVHEKERKSNAGRKPFDVVLMFKVLVAQTTYNLADKQVEYQIRDRLSFGRFLGLGIEERVPDATTVWNFRERLKALGLIEPLFKRFDDSLAAEGPQTRQGQIIDASIVPVPMQRNSREENRRIKQGEVPEDWSEAKREQKDVDARWTQKNGESAFGYKNHIGVDAEHKLIRTFAVTPANVHDSQVLDALVHPNNEDAGYESHICEKGQRDRPPPHARAAGQQPHPFQGPLARRARLWLPAQKHGRQADPHHRPARAEVKIDLVNLTYNILRPLQSTQFNSDARQA